MLPPTSGSERRPEEARREAHVPAQQPQAEEDPRLPPPNAHPRRACSGQGPSRPWPQAPVRLISRVRARATFAALARAPRVQRGPVWLRFVASDPPPRVAFAVGRPVGGAVTRNRARRRLRAAVERAAGGLVPGAYLFGAGPDVVTMPFDTLERSVAELVASTEATTR